MGYLEVPSFTPSANPNRPDATFAPGTWLVPEPGCYQIFVEIDGQAEGPFGVVISIPGS
jgi:hypothetical protein